MNAEWYEVERQSKMTGNWYSQMAWGQFNDDVLRLPDASAAKDVADRIRRYDGQVRIVRVHADGRREVVS